jgi:hypothetical protein
METQIHSAEEKHVSVKRYVSPVYVAEFDRIQEASDCDRPDRILFKRVEEDNILEWLANNSLCELRLPFSIKIHSDGEYLFMAREGAHIVYHSHVDVNHTPILYRTTQDKSYERRLMIRSQPAGIPLPECLQEALGERGFRQVEGFER